MISDRISHLEARILNSSEISAEQRAELLKLLESMKAEAVALAPAPAAAIPQSGVPAEAAAPSAALVPHDDETPIGSIANEIQESIAGLEASHPRLTQVANQVAVTLSNMGI